MSSTPETRKRHWSVKLLGLRWFRVCLLVAICIFEISLTYFLKSQGWLAATDLGTQILVVAIVLSPLLLALFIIAGKRFKLSAMLISLTLVAIFISFVVLPVLEEKNSRLAANRFHELGVNISNETFFGRENPHTSSDAIRIDMTPTPEWLRRISFTKTSLPRDNEVVSLHFETDDQIASTLGLINRCENLSNVMIGSGVTNDGLALVGDAIIDTEPHSLCLGDYIPRLSESTRYDLEFLSENRSIKHLYLLGTRQPYEEIAETPIPVLESLYISTATLPGNKIDWQMFFNSPTTQQLKRLSLANTSLGDKETIHFTKLPKLESLLLSQTTNISDLKFVGNIENLRQFITHSVAITDENLIELESAKGLEIIHIYNSAGVSDAGIKRLKAAFPDANVQVFK